MAFKIIPPQKQSRFTISPPETKSTYEDWLKQYSVADPDDPRHHYNYRGAYDSGVVPTRWRNLPEDQRAEDIKQKRNIPDDAFMWPDKFKKAGHPVPAKSRFRIAPPGKSPATAFKPDEMMAGKPFSLPEFEDIKRKEFGRFPTGPEALGAAKFISKATALGPMGVPWAMQGLGPEGVTGLIKGVQYPLAQIARAPYALYRGPIMSAARKLPYYKKRYPIEPGVKPMLRETVRGFLKPEEEVPSVWLPEEGEGMTPIVIRALAEAVPKVLAYEAAYAGPLYRAGKNITKKTLAVVTKQAKAEIEATGQVSVDTIGRIVAARRARILDKKAIEQIYKELGPEKAKQLDVVSKQLMKQVKAASLTRGEGPVPTLPEMPVVATQFRGQVVTRPGQPIPGVYKGAGPEVTAPAAKVAAKAVKPMPGISPATAAVPSEIFAGRPIAAEPTIPEFPNTNAAIKFGEENRNNPEVLEQLKQARQAKVNEAKKLTEAGITTTEAMQKVMDLGTEAQFYREALEEAAKPIAPKAGGQIFKGQPFLKPEEEISGRQAPIRITKDMVVTDIHGKKVELPEGEEYTPYEVTNTKTGSQSKIVLQDGKRVIVHKGQLANVKGQNIVLGEKPVAEEGVREITKRDVEIEEADILADPTVERLEALTGWKTVADPMRPTVVMFVDPETGDLNTAAEINRFAGQESPGPRKEQLSEAVDLAEDIEATFEKRRPETKFSEYVLPGGENYREVLLQVPVGKKADPKFLEDLEYNFKRGFLTKKQYEEIKRTGFEEPKAGFKSPHWDEPNVLAHIRLTDRYLTEPEFQKKVDKAIREEDFENPILKGKFHEGQKKILFIEEIQSDWAREARKKGTIRTVSESEKSNIYKENQESREVVFSKVKDLDLLGFDSAGQAVNAIMVHEDYVKRWNLEKEHDFIGAIERYKKAIKEVNSIQTGIPSHPALKNWKELAVKKVLDIAAREGYDGIAWTTGEQQAARYDLSKIIDSVDWYKNTDGTYAITAYRKGATALDKGNIKAEDLSGIVGKEPAEKILQGKGKSKDILKDSKRFGVVEAGRLSVKDLHIGGEWAKSLYDVQMPSILKKLTGKWGGKVKTINLEIGGLEGKNLHIQETEPGEFAVYATEELNKMGMPEAEFNTLQAAKDYIAEAEVDVVTQQALIFTPQIKEMITTGGAPKAGGLPAEREPIERVFKGGERIPDEIDTVKDNPYARKIAHQMVPLGNTQGAKVRHAKYYLENFKNLILQALKTNPHVKDVFGRSGTLSRIIDMVKPKDVKYTISDLDPSIMQLQEFNKSNPEGMIVGYNQAKDELVRVLAKETGLSEAAFKTKQQFRKEFFAQSDEAQHSFNATANKVANKYFRSTRDRLIESGIRSANEAGEYLFISRNSARGSEATQGIFNFAGFLKGVKLGEDPVFQLETAVKSQAKFLQKADIKVSDAFTEIKKAGKGDFILSDSPYAEEAGYQMQTGQWTVADSASLIKEIDKAYRRGAEFTYHDTYNPQLIALWESLGYRTFKIRVPSPRRKVGLEVKDELFVTSLTGVGERAAEPLLKAVPTRKELLEEKLAAARQAQREFEVKKIQKKLARLKEPPKKPPTTPKAPAAAAEEPEDIMKYFGEKGKELDLPETIPGLTAAETTEYEDAWAIATTETFKEDLFGVIRELGGLKSSKEKEEFAVVPVDIRGKIAVDDIIPMLAQQGYRFESESDLLDTIDNLKRARAEGRAVFKSAKASLQYLNKKIKAHTKWTERYARRVEVLMSRKTPTAEMLKSLREVVGLRKEKKLITEGMAYKRMLQRIDSETKKSYKIGKFFGKEQMKAEQAERSAAARERRDQRREVHALINEMIRLSERRMDLDYKDQIDAILEKYEFVVRTTKRDRRLESRREFIRRKEEEGEPLHIPDQYLDELERITLKDMTIDDLRELNEYVKNIAHAGILKGQLIAKKEARDYDKVKKAIIASVEKNAARELKVPDRMLTPSERKKTGREKFLASVDAGFALLKKVDFITEALDGYKAGIFNDEIVDVIDQAKNAELLLQDEIMVKLNAIMEKAMPNFKDTLKKQFTIEGSKLTKQEMFAVYANSQNEDNRYRLTQGFAWTEEKVDKIVSALTQEERKHVDDIMALVDTLWLDIQEVAEKLTGRRAKKVEFYWPIVADKDLSTRAARKALEKDLFKEIYQQFFVERGFIHERVGGKDPVDLNFYTVLLNHLDSVIHYVTHAAAVRDVQKLINDSDIKMAILKTQGEGIYRQFAPWLKTVANPRALSMLLNNAGVGLVDKWIGRLKRNTTVVTLGGKVAVSLKQGGSFSQTIHLIGMKDSLYGLKEFWGDPLGAAKFIYEKSPTMKFRRKTWDRDVRELLEMEHLAKLLSGKKGVRDAYFAMLVQVDRITTLPSWLGAYEKKMRLTNNDVQASIKYADQIAKRTQPTGMLKDLASIQRGPQMLKIFTMFYTHFSNAFNLMARTGGMLRAGKISVVDAMVAWWWLLILPGILGGVLGSMGYKKGKPIAKQMVRDIASYGFAMFPILGSIANSVIKGYQYKPSAVFEYPKSIIRVFKGKKLSTKARAAVNVLGYTYGLPSQQAIITISGLIDLLKGETADLRRLAVSKYRLGQVKQDKKFDGKPVSIYDRKDEKKKSIYEFSGKEYKSIYK